MKVELTRDEYQILIVALDRMDDEHHNHRGHFAVTSDGEESGLAFAPNVVGFCFEGHVAVACAQVLGRTPPPLVDEDWDPLWDFQQEIFEHDAFVGLDLKLTTFAHQRLKVTERQQDEHPGSTATDALTWANDVYGTAAVRDTLRAAIASREIVVSAGR